MFERRVRKAIEIFCRAPTLNCDAVRKFLALYRDVLSRDSHNAQIHPMTKIERGNRKLGGKGFFLSCKLNHRLLYHNDRIK